MSKPFRFFFELQDLVSGPASKMERQLREVNAKIKEMDLAAKQAKLDAMTDPLKRQRLELTIQRDKLRMAKEAMGESGKGAEGLRGKLRDLAVIGDVAARGFSFLAGKVAAFGRRAAEAISFRQGNLIGLEAMFGTAKAEEQMQAILGLTEKLRRSRAEIMGMAHPLLSLGMDPRDVQTMITLLEDLRAFKGPQGLSAMQQTFGVIEKLQSKPVVKENPFASLEGTLPLEQLYTNLSRLTGFAKGDLPKAFEMGVIRSDKAIAALGQTIAGLEGGEIGKLAAKSAVTLEGKLQALENRANRIFDAIAASPGFKVFNAAFENLLAVLGPKSKVEGVAVGLANKLGEFLKPLTGPEGKKRMEEFFDSLKGKIEGTMEGVVALGKALGTIGSFFDKVGTGLGKGGAAVATLVDPNANRFEKQEATKFLQDTFGLQPPPAPAIPAPSVPSAPARPAARTQTFNLGGIQIDARGATPQDAKGIAEKVADELRKRLPAELGDALEGFAIEQGAQGAQ